MLSRRTPPALTITEIASRVGFKDPSHFSRAFKALYGCSPAEFRKREHPYA
jgi:AraC-like DNA-binding protein